MLRNGGACKLNIEGTNELWLRDYNRLPWLKETDIGKKPSKAIALLELRAEGAEVTDAGLQRKTMPPASWPSMKEDGDNQADGA